MTDQLSPPEPRLWTPSHGFRDDTWIHADSADALEGNAGVILPLIAWLALDAHRRGAAAQRLGVMLAAGDALEKIVPFLADVPLVALAFPAFTDGRSSSKAEMLRSRYGFRGEVRATGQVLIDQIPLMIRAGFDAFEVSNPTALKRLEEGRIGGLPLHYQPAPEGDAPAAEKYSWRRRPAGD